MADFSEIGICDGCDKEKKLRRIESGQRLCRSCFQEIKPARAKHLAAYATLKASAERGISLPEDITKEQVERLRGEAHTLRFYLMDLWYDRLRRSCYSDDVDLETAAQMMILRGDDHSRRLLALEERRIAIGKQGLGIAIDDAIANEQTDNCPYWYKDHCIYEKETGREVAYYHFKPPLVQTDDYLVALKFLRSIFPNRI